MATSLDKLENKVKVHHLHLQHFEMVKRFRKLVQYIWRYSTKKPAFWPCHTWHSQMSSIISGVTQQKFTKFLHDIAISPLLSMRTFRQWYCNSFSNDSAKNASGISRDILPKSIDCHGNVPWDIGKRGKALLFVRSSGVVVGRWQSSDVPSAYCHNWGLDLAQCAIPL